MKAFAPVVVAAVALGCAAAATAKIGPSVRVCGATRCALVDDAATLRALNTFVYGPTRVTRVRAPRVDAPVFALDLGGVFSQDFEKFRSHGIICQRFERGRWYRVPERIARELRRVTCGLAPRRLSARVPRSC